MGGLLGRCKVDLAVKKYEFELKSIGKLLSSSLISAGCLVILTSNRIHILNIEQVVFLILFIQWQTLGLTISKLGIEQAVFAYVTKDPAIGVRPWKFLLYRTVPLALLFSGVVYKYTSLFISLVLFLSISLDTYSLIRNAELNGRKHYTQASIANLLNYPLFFTLLLGMGNFRRLDTNEVIGIFLFASLARSAWLWGFFQKEDSSKEFVFLASWKMGIQQGLNYVMFRIDQIYLAIFLPGISTSLLKKDFMARYLFMAKFPELISAVGLIIGAVLVPYMYIHFPFKRSSLFFQRKYHILFIVSIFVISISAAIYVLVIWRGAPLDVWFVIPFAIQSLLIFPANLLTYSMLRQGHVGALVRNLVVCALLGFLILCFINQENVYRYLFWLIPTQLVLFLGLSIFISWGPRRELFEVIE